MTKKIMTTLLIAGVSALAANAEGYQVNTLSARQNGMGHTGTALHLGAESMFYNPAGLTTLKSNVEFQGTFTGIFATATADYEGKKYETSNPASTPIAIHLGWKIYDNLAAGMSFFTPYGSGINWGDNWPGAALNQSVTLKVYTIQPTIAWRIMPGFSIGAGAMVTFGSVDLNKGLVTPDAINMVLAGMGNDYRFTDTPASVNINGKSTTTVGFNVGAMWDINKKITVGASYRSKMTLKVKSGEATMRYANEVASTILEPQLNVINNANFKASMPAVAVLNMGVAYKPIERLTLAFDAQLNFWHAYKQLDIEFLSESLSAYNQHLPKKQHNAWTFRVGGQFDMTERLALRLGMMVDTTPVDENHYNPETPGMTKIEPTCGFSFSPTPWMSFDASLMYVAGLGRDGSVTYTDLLTRQQKTFSAHYGTTAWCPSVGVRLNF